MPAAPAVTEQIGSLFSQQLSLSALKPPAILRALGAAMWALQGLVAGQPHVRGAALQALDHAPAINAGTVPRDDAVLALMWLARCDPSEANAGACVCTCVGRGVRRSQERCAVCLCYAEP